jgi:hypothetical protein
MPLPLFRVLRGPCFVPVIGPIVAAILKKSSDLHLANAVLFRKAMM